MHIKLILNMKKLVYCLVGMTLMLCSCKDDGVNVVSDRPVNTESGNFIHDAPETLNPKTKALLDNNRSHAYALIESRSQGEDAYSMLVVGWWMYEAIFAGGERPKAVESGYYIKFEDDFTYSYGQHKDVHGGGKYHLTFNTDDKPKLIMVDDNPTKTPEEWSILTKEDVLILVGSNYFGNNPKQMKLKKQMNDPTA